ncbi:hypothetical protein [Massilia sp. TS11]|uniref:hypothetical protein n=1 Tax=Massilia sp. TS11 TaxID=2908003 RepID=UPI001EDA7176|nr:hypothetical protein [Massilia sp. TS11]MCG2585759.1 hypothetical protein [Massilia sp. TS11]
MFLLVMHATYTFDFLTTVSRQLSDQLEGMESTALNSGTLRQLSNFQDKVGSRQGVYVLYYADAPVYLGKAENVSARLFQHLEKLRGRRGIDQAKIGYKALLLGKSMSTAANENILINIFKERHPDLWNGRGFGPKDPGKERDTTKPGWFDQAFPIEPAYPITLTEVVQGAIEIGKLFEQMKAQLPYVFRFDIDADLLRETIDITQVPCDARSLFQAAIDKLGVNWKGAILSYGMVLYRTDKTYPYGEEITARLGSA